MTSYLDGSTTRSGKYYRTNLEGDRLVYSLVKEVASQIPLATLLSNNPKGKNSPTPLPPPKENMAAHMKFLTFKHVGDEDVD